MNLVESATTLKTDLAALEQLRKSAGAADRFERRAKELEAPAKDLSQLATVISLLRNHSVPNVQFEELALGEWETRLKRLRENYEQDPTTILDPYPNEDVRAKLLSPLKQLPLDVSSRVSAAWVSWVSCRLPAVSDDILNVLSGIPALRNSVEKLRALKQEVSIAASRLPQTQAHIDGVLKRIQALETAWGALTGAGIPKEVIQFLRAAGQVSGAPYAMLTPAVMQWLIEHQLHQSLTVKVG